MTKLFTIILALSLCSCENNGVQTESTQIVVNGTELSIYIIDGCEYVGYLGMDNRGHFLTHKGNCRFCEQRRQINEAKQ